MERRTAGNGLPRLAREITEVDLDSQAGTDPLAHDPQTSVARERLGERYDWAGKSAVSRPGPAEREHFDVVYAAPPGRFTADCENTTVIEAH